MKFLILFVLLYIFLVDIINSQQTIYINSNNGNDNGSGTITNPYQTICKLNQVFNNVGNITVNIAYGDYYNEPGCILNILNIKNITILTYDDGSSGNSGIVNIKYIWLNIINSSLVVENLNIDIENNEFNSGSSSGTVGTSIQSSSVLFDGCQFNVSLSYKIETEKIISFNIFSIYNTNLIISNSIFESKTSLGLLEPILNIISSTVTLDNIIISKFQNFNNLIQFNGGTGNNVQINQITVIDSLFTTLISIESNENSDYFKINEIDLINNRYRRLIDIQSNTNISISNIQSICDNGGGNLNNLPSFISTGNSNGGGNSNILISNINFNCFGNSKFKNSQIEFKNITITKNTFSNDLFTLELNSTLLLHSSNLISIYNLLETGYFFNVQNSIIIITNCTIDQCSSPFINAIDESHVIITGCTFNNTRSNNIPFINIDGKSQLEITNGQFNQHFTTISAMLNLSTMSKMNMNSINVSKSWFDYGYLIKSDTLSNTTIDNLNVQNCFSQNTLFYSSWNFQLTNSIFKNNIGLNSISMFTFYLASVDIGNVIFDSNKFSPFIKSYRSIDSYISGILFQRNSGSFYYGDKDLKLHISNFKMLSNNVQIPLEYLISLDNVEQGLLDEFYLTYNYFSKYLFRVSNCQLNFTNFVYSYNVIINDNDIQLGDVFNYTSPNAQFIILRRSVVQFDNFIATGNTLSSSLFYVYDSQFSIDNSKISSNVVLLNSTVFESLYSNTIFNNSIAIGNSAIYSSINTKGLITHFSGDLIIESCEMSNNNFGLSDGCIAEHTYFADVSIFKILNSIFNNNIGNYAGVFNFKNMFYLTYYTHFYNNSFSNNYAKIGGGVIYTTEFSISFEYQNSNTFTNNTCCGMKNVENNFSSMFKDVWSNNTIIFHQPQVIEYQFLNYYNDTSLDIFGEFPIDITCDFGSNVSSVGSTLVIGGRGTINWKNTEKCYNSMVINIYRNIVPDALFFYFKWCPEYMYLDSNNQCQYCAINWTLSTGSRLVESDCYKCNNDKQNCIGPNSYAYRGYYLISRVYNCALDMCEEKNQCSTRYNTGALCYYCIDDQGLDVVTKNGIQCCTRFIPLLLLPIAIIVTLFSLTLSIVKYNLNDWSLIIGSFIIYLQINSVVFFSYSGIYILPLFRLSIDLLDGYCYWKDLNYIDKSLIVYAIIFWSFIISCSDISFKIISLSTRLLPNSKLSLLISKFLKRLNVKMVGGTKLIGFTNRFNFYINTFKLQSIWVLFQLYFIPLLFNSISLIVPMKKLEHNYLMVDFSVVYLEDKKTISLFKFSIFILVIISIVLVLYSIVLWSSNSLKNITILKTIFTNSNYKNTMYWWDQVIILKSFLFVVLSLTMIFNFGEFTIVVVLVQMVYTCFYFLIGPFKKSKKHLRNFNNLVNLSQLILFVLSGTALFKSLIPFYKGLILSCGSFFSILLILFYNIKKLKTNKKQPLII